MSLLRVCAEIDPNWEFFLSILKKAQWVCSWAYSEQFMKEHLMSGSGILWANFEQIYERNPRVFSMSSSGVFFFFEFTHHFDLNLPTGLIVIKLMGKFKKNYNLPTGYIVDKLFKNSQKTLNLPTGYDPLCPQWYWVTAIVQVGHEKCHESSGYWHTRYTLITEWVMRRLTNPIIWENNAISSWGMGYKGKGSGANPSATFKSLFPNFPLYSHYFLHGQC